jgi:hypothetical protein
MSMKDLDPFRKMLGELATIVELDAVEFEIGQFLRSFQKFDTGSRIDPVSS